MLIKYSDNLLESINDSGFFDEDTVLDLSRIINYSNMFTEELKVLFNNFVVSITNESISDTLFIISNLPLVELAKFAEFLIYMTSIKRRMSHDLETVVGDIDLAVITKSEGFRWIKKNKF